MPFVDFLEQRWGPAARPHLLLILNAQNPDTPAQLPPFLLPSAPPQRPPRFLHGRAALETGMGKGAKPAGVVRGHVTGGARR